MLHMLCVSGEKKAYYQLYNTYLYLIAFDAIGLLAITGNY